MALARTTATAFAALALALAGCGGGDDGGDTDADARAAVADFLAALGDQDTATACESLTADAQAEVATTLAKLTKQPSGECSDALGTLFDAARAADALAPVADLADGIRSGDVPDGEVTVAIAEDTGTVTLTAGDRLLPVPVEQVDGEWLVSGATGLLFGTGSGG